MTATEEKIISFIKVSGKTTPDMIERKFGLSRVMVHRYLKRFLQNSLVIKRGSAPHVNYLYGNVNLEAEIRNALKNNTDIISAYILGSSLTGRVNAESDFDLAVVVKNKDYVNEDVVYELVRNIKFPRDLDLSVVDKKSSPLFLFEIVSSGKRVFEKSLTEAIAFEDFALHNYYDAAHLRRINYSYIKQKFNYAG